MGRAGKSIEWAAWSWNPVKGKCPRGCKDLDGEVYCYMEAYYRRFKLDPELRLDHKSLQWRPPMNGLIFVGSSLDLFHPEIPDAWIQAILDFISEHPFADFAMLTKTPARYANFDLPVNCIYGTTDDGTKNTLGNVSKLIEAVRRPMTRFVSFEPLLGLPSAVIGPATGLDGRFIDWIIIGADSRPGAGKAPDEWADYLIESARRMGIPVWLKDNYRYKGKWEGLKEPPFEVSPLVNESVGQ